LGKELVGQKEVDHLGVHGVSFPFHLASLIAPKYIQHRHKLDGLLSFYLLCFLFIYPDDSLKSCGCFLSFLSHKDFFWKLSIGLWWKLMKQAKIVSITACRSMYIVLAILDSYSALRLMRPQRSYCKWNGESSHITVHHHVTCHVYDIKKQATKET
jgi:hypothetical protein